MIVEALHDIRSFYQIVCCPFDVFPLLLEEKTPLICPVLWACLGGIGGDLEVFLPASDLEKSLAGTIVYPDLVG